MATFNWTLFDTQPITTSVPEVIDFFQIRQGGNATQTKYKTNGRGNGQLPDNENFTINEIMVTPSEQMNEADSGDWFYDAYLEVTYKDRLIFSSPLKAVIGLSAFEGVNNQAAASDNAAFGMKGHWYKLAMPILVEGGNSFKVSLGHSTSINSNREISIYLRGELELQ